MIFVSRHRRGRHAMTNAITHGDRFTSMPSVLPPEHVDVRLCSPCSCQRLLMPPYPPTLPSSSPFYSSIIMILPFSPALSAPLLCSIITGCSLISFHLRFDVTYRVAFVMFMHFSIHAVILYILDADHFIAARYEQPARLPNIYLPSSFAPLLHVAISIDMRAFAYGHLFSPRLSF